jgi:hypothetical protein
MRVAAPAVEWPPEPAARRALSPRWTTLRTVRLTVSPTAAPLERVVWRARLPPSLAERPAPPTLRFASWVGLLPRGFVTVTLLWEPTVDVAR